MSFFASLLAFFSAFLAALFSALFCFSFSTCKSSFATGPYVVQAQSGSNVPCNGNNDLAQSLTLSKRVALILDNSRFRQINCCTDFLSTLSYTIQHTITDMKAIVLQLCAMRYLTSALIWSILTGFATIALRAVCSCCRICNQSHDCCQPHVNTKCMALPMLSQATKLPDKMSMSRPKKDHELASSSSQQFT